MLWRYSREIIDGTEHRANNRCSSRIVSCFSRGKGPIFTPFLLFRRHGLGNPVGVAKKHVSRLEREGLLQIPDIGYETKNHAACCKPPANQRSIFGPAQKQGRIVPCIDIPQLVGAGIIDSEKKCCVAAAAGGL